MIVEEPQLPSLCPSEFLVLNKAKLVECENEKIEN